MLSVGFEVIPKGLEVRLDAKQQKVISFNLALQIPWDELQAVATAREPARVAAPAGAGVKASPVTERTEVERSLADLEEPRKVEISRPAADNTARLRRAVQQGHLGTVQRFLRAEEAEFLNIISAPDSNLMSLALQSKRRLEMMNLLIQGRCSVNAPCQDGRSPLHCAVAEIDSCGPIAVRLLLCSRADQKQQDRDGLTPLDYLKSQGFNASRNLKQIMSDLVEGPTEQVAVLESSKRVIQTACFANSSCSKVAFQTDSSVGLYDLQSNSVTVKKVLSKSKATSLKGIAVNPETPSIAALMDVTGDNPSQVVMLWPHGDIEGEQPLQWCFQDKASDSKPSRLPSTIACSRSSKMIVACRSSGGMILVWHLHSSYAQLVSETVLAEADGGALALSCGGHWIALDSGSSIQVWNLDQTDLKAASIDRQSTALAVIEDRSSSNGCLLAIAGDVSSGSDVFRVQLDGSSALVHHVPAEPYTSSNFRMLRFCDQDCDTLLSVFEDGLLMLSRLDSRSNKPMMCLLDDASLQSIDISPDKSLMVSALQNCFRVFRVLEAEA